MASIQYRETITIQTDRITQRPYIYLKIQQVLKCVASTPLMRKRLVLPAR